MLHQIEALESRLGYVFEDKDLAKIALTHKSFFYESQHQTTGHNEKLEFLGDAVLDLVLSELLMESFPEDGEGSLSKKRASLVNEGVLAGVAKAMDLGSFLILGKGEKTTGGYNKPRLLASAVEALLGAVFLDGGFSEARDLARRCYEPILNNMNPEHDYFMDYKTRLQEVIQKEMKMTPTYELKQEIGPPHDRLFEVALKIGEHILSYGRGRSKKQAEQEAAQKALESLTKDEEAEC
jgi:ribonuclease-3